MELLTSESTGTNFLPVVLQYAILMTKILHHLILSSLPSLVVDGKAHKHNHSNEKDDINIDNDVNVIEKQRKIENAARAIDSVFEMLLKYIPLSSNFLHERTTSQSLGGNSNSDDDINTINESLKTLLDEFFALVVATQKAHPVAFARFLPPFLNLFSSNLEKVVSDKEMEPLFVIPQMMFLGNVISCSHYRPDEESNESMETYRTEVHNNGRRAITSKGDVSIDPLSISNAVQHVWKVFLTIERIHMLVNVSLFFMMLKESHLADWSDDPESFFVERRDAVADDDMIACAQNLYLSLLESKCELAVVENISSFINRSEEQIEAAHRESGLKAQGGGDSVVLFWDSIYTCIGLSLSALKRNIGFDVNNWISSCLSHVFKALTMKQSQNQVSSQWNVLF